VDSSFLRKACFSSLKNTSLFVSIYSSSIFRPDWVSKKLSISSFLVPSQLFALSKASNRRLNLSGYFLCSTDAANDFSETLHGYRVSFPGEWLWHSEGVALLGSVIYFLIVLVNLVFRICMSSTHQLLFHRYGTVVCCLGGLISLLFEFDNYLNCYLYHTGTQKDHTI